MIEPVSGRYKSLAVHDIRAHQARTKCGYADPLAPQVNRKSFRQTDHRELRRGIRDGSVQTAGQPGKRCGVDDMAAAALQQMGQKNMYPVNDPPEIDINDPFPVFNRNLFHVPHHVNTGIVHEDIHPAHFRNRLMKEVLNLREPGHIGRDRQTSAPEALYFSQHPSQALAVQIRDDHIGAFPGQGERRRTTDPAGCTRHNRDFSFYLQCAPPGKSIPQIDPRFYQKSGPLSGQQKKLNCRWET